MKAFMACASLLIIAVTVNSNAIPQDHTNRLRDQLRSTACVDIAGAVACNDLKKFCSSVEGVSDACCATCKELKRDTVIKSKGLMKTRQTCVDEYSDVACDKLRLLCSEVSVSKMCCKTCATNTGGSLWGTRNLRRYLDENED